MTSSADNPMLPSKPEFPSPDFSVLDGATEAEPNIADRYPDYEFGLTEEQMVQRGALPMSDNDRLRAVCTALAVTCGDEFEQYVPHEHRSKRLNRANKYLAETVRVKGGRKRRREIVNHGQAFSELLDGLATDNNPVAQILFQVNEKFQESLSVKQLNTLTANLLTVTHWNRLHDIYAKQVDKHQIHPRPGTKTRT